MSPVLWSIVASADPVARWTVLPSESLPALGLGSPTTVSAMPELSRYPLGDRGFVTVVIAKSSDDADRAFDGLYRTGATFWAEAPQAIAADDLAGDGASTVLLRRDNVVVHVRDAQGQSLLVAEQIFAALR